MSFSIALFPKSRGELQQTVPKAASDCNPKATAAHGKNNWFGGTNGIGSFGCLPETKTVVSYWIGGQYVLKVTFGVLSFWSSGAERYRVVTQFDVFLPYLRVC